MIWGCEEVIVVDINSSDPQLVIEAQLSNEIGNNAVIITESTDFYNPNEYNKISNAEITVTDENEERFIFEEIESGLYKHNSLTTKINASYSIEVKLENKIYRAESFSPPLLSIDSLSYKLEPRPFNDKKYLELHVYFQDPADEINFARVVVYKNDERINKIFLYDDRLTNGNKIDFFFFNFDEDEEFNSGDKIKVELQVVDEQVFTYLRTLRRALAASTGGPFGPASPANPISNWDNNALGYFNAFGFVADSLVIE